MPKRINWYEKPATRNMTTEQLWSEAQSQNSYFDVFPSPVHSTYDNESEVLIHDDEGRVYLKARRQSRNSWRVQTCF